MTLIRIQKRLNRAQMVVNTNRTFLIIKLLRRKLQAGSRPITGHYIHKAVSQICGIECIPWVQ